MDRPKLYIKNEKKGRYEPYREPEPPFDNCLYRKRLRGKRVVYEPCSMLLTNDIGEGVWVVVKHPYGRSISRGEYLRDCFRCHKVSEIDDFPLARLGGMERLADYLSRNWDSLPKNTSQYDLCRAIVGLLYQYDKEKDGADV